MVEIALAERALELDNIRAGYGETVVLEDIRLALGASETVSIIGRNGVGKTTLLATIMGHTTLHGGRISLHGGDISRLATYRRVTAGLGYVPQEREIFPSLSLRENLEVAARPGSWTIETVFDLFPRLAERADNRGNQLSGGEQQMLAIGRALIGNPTRAVDGRTFGGPRSGDCRRAGARGEAPYPGRRARDRIGRAELASCA